MRSKLAMDYWSLPVNIFSISSFRSLLRETGPRKSRVADLRPTVCDDFFFLLSCHLPKHWSPGPPIVLQRAFAHVTVGPIIDDEIIISDLKYRKICIQNDRCVVIFDRSLLMPVFPPTRYVNLDWNPFVVF